MEDHGDYNDNLRELRTLLKDAAYVSCRPDADPQAMSRAPGDTVRSSLDP